MSLQARVVALESALPPLRVAAKRLRFTPKRSKAKSVAGGLESQLLADIALEGAVSCSTDAVAAAAPAKPPGAHMFAGWLAGCIELNCLSVVMWF